jgi:hypothetical protein
MSLPPIKQRIWQALRLKPSTLNDLALVVDAPKNTIYVHLIHWQAANLLIATKMHNRKPGPAPLQYSLIDRNIVNPPSCGRSMTSLEKSRQIWKLLESKPSTVTELCVDLKKQHVYKILRGWLRQGLIVGVRSSGDGDRRKLPMLYSIVDSIH